jgi:cytochrome c
MKTIMVSMVAVASIAFAGAAMAADMPAAGKAKCSACHEVDRTSAGPSFKEIAAKYKGDKDAVSKLEANIAKGGKFGWKKTMAMPPAGMGANKAEIKAMAEYIVSLSQ